MNSLAFDSKINTIHPCIGSLSYKYYTREYEGVMSQKSSICQAEITRLFQLHFHTFSLNNTNTSHTFIISVYMVSFFQINQLFCCSDSVLTELFRTVTFVLMAVGQLYVYLSLCLMCQKFWIGHQLHCQQQAPPRWTGRETESLEKAQLSEIWCQMMPECLTFS